jgi:transposase
MISRMENTITAKSSMQELPDDTDTLKQMILTLLSQINDLNGQLLYLKRQLFGRKSEKLNPAQKLLFENLYNEVQAKIEQQKQQPQSEPVQKKKNANHNGRKPFPSDLPVQEIPIEPQESELICPDCKEPKVCIGSEKTEKVEYIPASFYIKRYVRHKYACKKCQGNISIGQLPPMVIDKGIAGEGLLAHIITSKYTDHLPLNRLENIFQRHGIKLNVSTMCDSVGRCAEVLEPLVKKMHENIIKSDKIHSDDTSIQVKSNKKKGETYTGYLWVYIDDAGNVVFDFTPTRGRQGPIDFLKGFEGLLHADAYSGYDELFRRNKSIIEIGCNAHSRRKFENALDDADPVGAANVVALYGKLYEIEKFAKENKYDSTQLLQLRQEKSKPVLAQIKKIVDDYKIKALPKSLMGKAVTYAINQWDALARYADNPLADIDNNLAERTLRTVCLGRKNYLFMGSEAGARRAAIIYSLVASCKLKGIDPFKYFRDVLCRISTHPASRIDELLPNNWKPQENSAESSPTPAEVMQLA